MKTKKHPAIKKKINTPKKSYTKKQKIKNLENYRVFFNYLLSDDFEPELYSS